MFYSVTLIILIPLILLLIGGIVVLIIFSVKKKKINKKLEEDKENIENGKPITGKKKKSTSLETITTMQFLVLVFSIGMYFLILCFNIWNLYKEMEQYYSNLDSEIESLENNLENEIKDVYRNQSIMSSFEVTKLDETFDKETNTERYKITIIPREISSDTVLSLKIDGQEYVSERNENTFEIIYNKNIFKGISDSVYVNITSNGITKIEEIDGEYFSDIYSIKSKSWSDYFPSFYISDLSEKSICIQDGNLKISKPFSFCVDESDGKKEIKSLNIQLFDGNKLLYEQKNEDYTLEHYGLEDSQNTYKKFVCSMDKTFDNIESDKVYFILEIKTTDGYAITSYIYILGDGSSLSFQKRQISYNGEVIYTFDN